jgi:hypothetical protein
LFVDGMGQARGERKSVGADRLDGHRERAYHFN